MTKLDNPFHAKVARNFSVKCEIPFCLLPISKRVLSDIGIKTAIINNINTQHRHILHAGTI